MNLELAAVIAIVVIVSLIVGQKVVVNLTKDGVRLSTDKNKHKDRTEVEKIKKSNVDIETREGQDVRVKDVSDHSDVRIK